MSIYTVTYKTCNGCGISNPDNPDLEFIKPVYAILGYAVPKQPQAMRFDLCIKCDEVGKYICPRCEEIHLHEADCKFGFRNPKLTPVSSNQNQREVAA